MALARAHACVCVTFSGTCDVLDVQILYNAEHVWIFANEFTDYAFVTETERKFIGRLLSLARSPHELL